MPWWIGTLLGSIALAVKNSLSRMWDMTPQNIALLQIPLILAGLFYWYGFRNAPKFINCWFLGTAFNTLSAFILGKLFFDKAITERTIIAVILISIGAYLLAR